MPKRVMTLNDLFAMKAVGRPAISPDGRRVVFELKRFDLAKNKNFCRLMLADVDHGGVVPLTLGDFNDTTPKWSPDGTRLGFLSDRAKGNCLFVLPMTGGDPTRITEPDGFVHDFAWSPDGKRLAYSYQPMNDREKLVRDGQDDEIKKRPQYKHITRAFHKLDGRGWWNGNYTHVWIVGSDGNQKPRQLTHGNYDDAEPRFSPDGQRVSFVSNRIENPDGWLDNADIFVIKPSGGRLRQVTHRPGWCGGHSWSPDGQWIAYLGNGARRGQAWKHMDRIWLVSSDGKQSRELTRELDNPCRNVTLGDVSVTSFEAAPPIWSADGSRLFFLLSEDGATRLYSRSLKRPDARCEIGGEINILHVQRTASDGPLVVASGTATEPGDIFMADPDEDFRPVRISDVNRKLMDSVGIVKPEPFHVKSGPVEVYGWVMKPPGFKLNRKYPTILEIHGGPQGQYGYSFFHEMQWLAAKGYVVVLTNPRGSAGYGLDFQKSIHAAWGGRDYQDLMKVTDWIFSRRYVDAKRVGVTGGSYGGYMTNWMVGHTDRFKAAVTQRSVVNLESMFGTSDYGVDLGHDFGGHPWENLKGYRRQSPLTFVKNIHTPLLIEHEEEDHRCPIEQAEQLFTSLKVLGRTVEMIRFEGESHGLSRGGRPRNRAERLRRMADWFERYL